MREYRDSKVQQYFLAAVAGASVAKTFTAPLERLKLVHQTYELLKISKLDQSSYLNQIMREQKLFSLWRGNFMNVLRTIPNTLIRYPLFELLHRHHPSRDFPTTLATQTAAASFSSIFSYPFDVIRVRLSSDMNHFNKQKNYANSIDCLKKTLYYEGFTGIYKGYLIYSLALAPYLGLTMTLYQQLKQLVQPQTAIPYLYEFVSLIGVGPLAAVAAMTITYPLDTIRRRMQMNGSIGARRDYLSTVDCVKKMMRNEGLGGYYKGIWFCLLKIVPESAIQFSIYEKIMEANLNE